MAKEYNFSKAANQCHACSRKLEVGEEFMAVLKELEDDFQRLDYCLDCWSKTGGTGVSPVVVSPEMAATEAAEPDAAQGRDSLPAWAPDTHGQDAHATEEDIVGLWRSSVPQPAQKKKLFIDDDLLVNFFERLDGATEPAKVDFRYVLGLVLMRKRKLAYEGVQRQDGQEFWKMRFKGTDRTVLVLDPKMDEDRIADVSLRLGEILEGEL